MNSIYYILRTICYTLTSRHLGYQYGDGANILDGKNTLYKTLDFYASY
jgi:hypothetical protein